MGIIELDTNKQIIKIVSHFFLYGNAISEEIRKNMEEEINEMWNEPKALEWLENKPFLVLFDIRVFLKPAIEPIEIISNRDARYNYFRIENFARGNISYVDGLGCNTGYFLNENLYKNSTTAAHEYGHTLGLPHPDIIDIRGKGVPGIMYPRGTWVDANYQYNPEVKAGEVGGTLYPIYRRVKQEDIRQLYLEQKIVQGNRVLGTFSSIYHEEETPI